MKIRKVFWIVALAAMPASAVIYSSSFVLGNWVEKFKGIKTVHVHQCTTIFDSKFPNGSVAIEEDIWIRHPSDFRRSSTYPNGKLELLVTKDRAMRVWAGKAETAPLVDTLGPLGGLYLYTDKGRLNSFLRQLGVDLSKTQWVLSDRQVALGIGDPKGSHWVFSKQDSVPLGFEIGEKNYRLDMGNPTRFPIRYPSGVALSVAGRLSEKIEVQTVDVNVPLPDSVFDMAHWRSSPEKK